MNFVIPKCMIRGTHGSCHSSTISNSGTSFHELHMHSAAPVRAPPGPGGHLPALCPQTQALTATMHSGHFYFIPFEWKTGQGPSSCIQHCRLESSGPWAGTGVCQKTDCSGCCHRDPRTSWGLSGSSQVLQKTTKSKHHGHHVSVHFGKHSNETQGQGSPGTQRDTAVRRWEHGV